MSVVDNISESCDALGQVDLSGVTLDSADPSLLNVSMMDLDQHVAMQPSAIAYYGSLLKEASRRVSAHKRAYDRWEKKQYAIAKAALTGTKHNIPDVEARFIVDNESDIEKWEEQQDKFQFEYDSLNIWYEAWRQKSFSIREYVGITDDERWNSSSSTTSGERLTEPSSGEPSLPSSDRVRKVREAMRKNREAK